MWFACRDGWEWTVSSIACVLALSTALVLARAIAARLAGATPSAPPDWLRAGWLFALAFYDLLLVFDGRYRDFPLGLFLLPCIGYALLAGLSGRGVKPWLEERFLAAWLPLLAAIVLLQESGLTPVTWLWLGLNLLLAVPVLVQWRRTRLQPQQAQAADQ